MMKKKREKIFYTIKNKQKNELNTFIINEKKIHEIYQKDIVSYFINLSSLWHEKNISHLNYLNNDELKKINKIFFCYYLNKIWNYKHFNISY